jgi:hypothetical protein
MLFIAGNRESDRIVEILDRLEEQYGRHFAMLFKSITFDNGTEFSDRPSRPAGRPSLAFSSATRQGLAALRRWLRPASGSENLEITDFLTEPHRSPPFTENPEHRRIFMHMTLVCHTDIRVFLLGCNQTIGMHVAKRLLLAITGTCSHTINL